MTLEDLLPDLVCPESHQALRLAAPAQVASLNERIARGEVRNRGGAVVAGRLDGGLLTADDRWLYPIRGRLPVLLVDEAIGAQS